MKLVRESHKSGKVDVIRFLALVHPGFPMPQGQYQTSE
jgi:hypothetical protein